MEIQDFSDNLLLEIFYQYFRINKNCKSIVLSCKRWDNLLKKRFLRFIFAKGTENVKWLQDHSKNFSNEIYKHELKTDILMITKGALAITIAHVIIKICADLKNNQ